MKPLRVLVILGSVRQGRMSERVATFVISRLVAAAGVSVELIDLRALDFPIMEERLSHTDTPPPGVAELGQKIAGADALVVVSPEYNHGYPGVLKNALDYFYKEYRRKPIALVTVSSGGHGGVNAWAQLVTVLVNVGALVVPKTLAVSHVERSFAEDGTALDEAYVKRAESMIEELIWLATRVRD